MELAIVGRPLIWPPQAEQERGWGEKHEIYAAASGDHRFYDLLSQGRGGGWRGDGPLGPPFGPPRSATASMAAASRKNC